MNGIHARRLHGASKLEAPPAVRMAGTKPQQACPDQGLIPGDNRLLQALARTLLARFRLAPNRSKPDGLLQALARTILARFTYRRVNSIDQGFMPGVYTDLT